ncbi:MAG: virulence protein [Hyphomicrobiales bacterium]|nr:virulence protein [Hyphomicrobiales bacterium]
MYAIAFDLEIATLRKEYGDPYNQAYYEVRKELEALGFNQTQESMYLHKGEDGLTAVYRAINKLSGIPWFKEAVRDIRVFKVEDWSDFTDIVKQS